VDRLDADGIGISGSESTNPATRPPLENPLFKPPASALAAAVRSRKPDGGREILDLLEHSTHARQFYPQRA